MRLRFPLQHGYLATVLYLCSFMSHHAVSGEVLEAYVNNDGDNYFLHLDMRINGTSRAVYDVLIDFANIPQVNDSIKFSEIRESRGDVHRVYFETDGCVLFFCRRVKQLVTVTELGRGYIMSITDPQHSDLEYGRTLWQVMDEGSTTRIKYNAEFVPDFWVPPLFGPYIFKKRMLHEGQKTIHGIERLIKPTTE